MLPYFNKTTFSTNFVLNAGVQNSASWNISNLDFFGILLTLDMSLKSEWVFLNAKIYQKR